MVDTIQTADNAYVSVSQLNLKSFGVRKIASSGRRVWERILRLQVEEYADLAAITQTTDGGYILLVKSFDCPYHNCLEYGINERAGILIELRSNGTVAWIREYRTRFNETLFTSFLSTADGGVIVTGSARNSLMLARYTSTGSILWSKSFPDLRVSNLYFFPQLVQTPDNSFILVAKALDASAAFVIVKDSGTILWKKSLQMPDFSVQTIAATSDNGIVLAGSCKRNCSQLFVVRLKADGNVESKLRYSLQGPRLESIRKIIQTSDGGLTITGSVIDTGNHSNVFVAKIDSKGKASFQQSFSIVDSYGVSVFALSDGYLLFGDLATSPYTIILKLDSQGLLPGCDIVTSAAISPIPFGKLRISQRQINVAADLPLGTSNIAGSSKAARSPVSDLCP